MPQDDVAVARGADVDIAGEAQHPVRSGGEHAHGILAGVKVEVPNRPGCHQVIIFVPAAQLDLSVPHAKMTGWSVI
jgi:hypothetical protein